MVSTRFAGDAACPASYQICPKTGFQDAAIAAAVIIAIIAIIVIIAIIAFALGIVIMKIVIIFIVTSMATTTIIIVVPTFSFLPKAPKATNNFKSEFVLLCDFHRNICLEDCWIIGPDIIINITPNPGQWEGGVQGMRDRHVRILSG